MKVRHHHLPRGEFCSNHLTPDPSTDVLGHSAQLIKHSSPLETPHLTCWADGMSCWAQAQLWWDARLGLLLSRGSTDPAGPCSWSSPTCCAPACSPALTCTKTGLGSASHTQMEKHCSAWTASLLIHPKHGTAWSGARAPFWQKHIHPDTEDISLLMSQHLHLKWESQRFLTYLTPAFTL